jgi:hypothetical protein
VVVLLRHLYTPTSLSFFSVHCSNFSRRSDRGNKAKPGAFVFLQPGKHLSSCYRKRAVSNSTSPLISYSAVQEIALALASRSQFRHGLKSPRTSLSSWE